jgi:hypothetical protein
MARFRLDLTGATGGASSSSSSETIASIGDGGSGTFAGAAGLVVDGFGVKKEEIDCCLVFCDDGTDDPKGLLFGAIGAVNGASIEVAVIVNSTRVNATCATDITVSRFAGALAGLVQMAGAPSHSTRGSRLRV